MSLTTAEQQNVLNGRKLVDTYRKAHQKMYEDNDGKQDNDVQSQIQDTMVQGLKNLGYTLEEKDHLLHQPNKKYN